MIPGIVYNILTKCQIFYDYKREEKNMDHPPSRILSTARNKIISDHIKYGLLLLFY